MRPATAAPTAPGYMPQARQQLHPAWNYSLTLQGHAVTNGWALGIVHTAGGMLMCFKSACACASPTKQGRLLHHHAHCMREPGGKQLRGAPIAEPPRSMHQPQPVGLTGSSASLPSVPCSPSRCLRDARPGCWQPGCHQSQACSERRQWGRSQLKRFWVKTKRAWHSLQSRVLGSETCAGLCRPPSGQAGAASSEFRASQWLGASSQCSTHRLESSLVRKKESAAQEEGHGRRGVLT